MSSLSGVAVKIIKSIEITGQNYHIAWELLQQRYDNPRSLKKKHLMFIRDADRRERIREGNSRVS